ncbi:MAG: hypothetical protein JF888_11010 [Candidatus Dormibacteraeota bacterium]|uniref:Uncharacterized protein n=1 Tax=Candidatus Dormiibacter inghamiae TaxID=3127013 RepID=A0A934KDW3_9BACT|nr:hypothetical protein [Candidatus Dormibacteraeota bacterium]MBJ7607273.1 hypothetical protein [Candidatus Dormibacteraeota bacterium]
MIGRQSAGLVAAAGVLMVAVIWAGLQIGVWWLALPAGFLLTLLVAGAPSLHTAWLAAAAAWALPLVLLTAGGDAGRSSVVLSGILGFPSLPLLAALLTVVFGALLGLAGGWLGAAVRRVLRPAR